MQVLERAHDLRDVEQANVVGKELLLAQEVEHFAAADELEQHEHVQVVLEGALAAVL